VTARATAATADTSADQDVLLAPTGTPSIERRRSMHAVHIPVSMFRIRSAMDGVQGVVAAQGMLVAGITAWTRAECVRMLT